MNLTVREAAVLLGRSPRTVRAQVARGVLPGRKVGGRWRLKRETLPLTEAQRRQLRRKAEAVRRAVDQALPEAASRRRGRADEQVSEGCVRSIQARSGILMF